jgi:nucleotide-binding universal stress UspA family protein
MCALDLKLDSRMVLGWAAAFARDCCAELSIVHALPSTLTYFGGVYFDPDWSLNVTAEARRRISDLQLDLESGGEVSIPIGDPPHAIADAAAEWKADLLVIGRGHHTGLARIRTHAYAILRESPCPVVVV